MQLAANWPDLLEKDFRKIYMDQYDMLPMMVPDLYNVQKSDAAFEKTSAVGQVPDHVEFTGKVSEISPTQGLNAVIVALVKLGQMLETPKTFITDKVKRWRMEQWAMSRKDFFGGLLDFSMEKVGSVLTNENLIIRSIL